MGKTPKAAGQDDAEAEAALAEAIRLSMQDASPDDINMADDEDELAAAIRMSMAGGQPAGALQQPQQEATPQQHNAGSSDPKDLVKELFDEYRRQGMNPNEAAIKAMAEAKTRVASAKRPSASPDHKELVKQLFEEYRQQGVAPNDAAAQALKEANR